MIFNYLGLLKKGVKTASCVVVCDFLAGNFLASLLTAVGQETVEHMKRQHAVLNFSLCVN